MAMLDGSTVLKKTTQQVSCNLNEEVAILDLDKSLYFGLEGVGAHIWQILEKPCSVSDICTAVTDHFEVSAEQCKNDVLLFLNSLQAAGLVQTVG
jgi:hypothetical protein